VIARGDGALRAAYELKRIAGRLQLCAPGARAGISLDIDDVRRRVRQRGKLALAKACGGAGTTILDATAGFGADGIALAAIGATVLMVERDASLFALLEDAVARACAELPMRGSIECRHADARDVLAAGERFDTIYFDPMFPVRRKSALPRKSAQWLAAWVGAPDDDLRGLIAAAGLCARSRVVVKRRRHDPVVDAPTWQIVGRSVRFDVYRGAAVDAG
jgi:16S rRNA (guanine1516-N2)-methyltransferase